MSDNEFEIHAEQEWSYFVESSEIGSKAVHLEISPPENTMSYLCKRLGIHSIEMLKAELTLQRNDVSKVVYVHGKIYADIHQKCVVSAEPVQEHLEDEFEGWFSDPNQAVSFTKAKRERMSRKEQSDQPMIEEYEDPEPIQDGKIDLGELIVQSVSLALNSYPRVEGVVYEAFEKPLGDAPEGTFDNPFAALKDWKNDESKKEK